MSDAAPKKMKRKAYEAELARVPGLLDLGRQLGEGPEERALGAEVLLEGLTQHVKLAREDLDSQISYRELMKLQLLRRPSGRLRED